ncbi:class I SAM-dependent methyltransferase [Heliophilum fasciatum]|uniref:Methyltransferase family protein n=1 Tax=Heliophilum fasciatum TaxID=35700 RepID=A0A4R2RM39_9FIRM|nr:class I SAM-dependent methyltransferase [Heliophilum fasciatum]MCW2278201.1 SAM-dependent methyltransferase [Heliophilum fasciatum]TCP63978.1 methyltransferase family protein [Heliophilum fasciatum]
MSFYQQLARYYDLVFPYRPIQVEFLEKAFRSTGARHLLDVACGTGSQAIPLAERGFQVFGVDAGVEMVELAQKKAGDLPVRFEVAQMQDLKSLRQQLFAADGKAPWDGAYCIGNSLPHLEDDQEIVTFLSDLRRDLLQPGSLLIIQIVNFPAILSGQADFPVLRGEMEGAKVAFYRSYQELDTQRVTFCTRLEIEEPGQAPVRLENQFPLRALSQVKLQVLLQDAGFEPFAWYGDFGGSPWQENSPAIIVTSRVC